MFPFSDVCIIQAEKLTYLIKITIFKFALRFTIKISMSIIIDSKIHKIVHLISYSEYEIRRPNFSLISFHSYLWPFPFPSSPFYQNPILPFIFFLSWVGYLLVTFLVLQIAISNGCHCPLCHWSPVCLLYFSNKKFKDKARLNCAFTGGLLPYARFSIQRYPLSQLLQLWNPTHYFVQQLT